MIFRLSSRSLELNWSDMLSGCPNTYSISSPCITPIHSPHNEIVNEDSTFSSSTSDKEWIPAIKHKRVNSSKVETGKEQYTSSMYAEKKWIYIEKIAGSNVTEEDISDYLAPVFQGPQFDLKKLQPQGQNSAFIVGTSSSEEVYEMKSFGQTGLY
ncbi:hypothetical protein WA026_019709 [Henosepilachna vigintioctopunctata]|uniref:Uncharacterized protein n=1 Tax=Henosepilachna vigintioctopunctata TaxID=420089 RepID=A0AAW1UQE1_9CUCU